MFDQKDNPVLTDVVVPHQSGGGYIVATAVDGWLPEAYRGDVVGKAYTRDGAASAAADRLNVKGVARRGRR